MQLNYIREVVEKNTGLDISKKTHIREYVEARWVYFTLAKEYTFFSLSAIGKVLDKDHSTVLHGLRKFKEINNTSGFLRTNYINSKSIIDNIGSPVLDNDINARNLTEIKRLKSLIIDLESSNRKRFKNKHLLRLINSDDETITNFCETRLKPFFKMLDNRVTYEDILKNRPKSVYS